ncbi:RNA polymerase subunit sigma [Curtobacterium sp. MCBD17_034]|uniref:sigma-70 family RNA polymerase sigma factor n=1 Tax=unclassified Curtobacterium TaxID=257496 RepID=UPI000DA98F79|nr:MULTISPECIES: sigma-70 family RNA polymerase sigma factor [unclassified Curtobacterium]PZF60156.1 RNA polymerase subunit sigma [Curtobacterium sp. MCBD17_034]PZF61752.1 RNA polymerase subunit sigma [Curtobacterium sp. MCBD17_013]PZM34841.1 RNA polymerase subunit sigma [Curtobacterium sp. MCBD17_031]
MLHRRPTTDPVTTSDDALLIAVCGGDREAFRQLYVRLTPRLVSFARRTLVDHAQAEEVVHDVLLDVWSDDTTPYDPARASATSWLQTLTHRRAVDRVRSIERTRQREIRVGMRDFEPVDHDAAERLDVLAEWVAVRNALAGLTPNQRSAVLLRYRDGLTDLEVADRLSVPVGTAKTRIRSGLRGLRRCLSVAV